MFGARTCLVTGAGRGIGREVAIRLAAAGHRVALTARSQAELTQTAAACDGALTLPLDLTAPGAVDELFARVEAELGPVEILVANAGAAVSAPLARTTDEDWQRMLDLNLTAPFRCIRRAVPAMTAAGWGRVVVIGSIASRVGAPYIAAYAAAKHGVLGLVRSAAAELVKTGVTVNAVCPAYVDTPMTDGSVASIVEKTGRDPEQVRTMLAQQQPIGRLITVAEVAAAVLFCVDNGAVTGQGINVDGGAVQS
ncbi:MAG TPA: SDR family NAD(P)-dependent oxidoreductase [Micromonosporaceae bacterium]|nr:SDR family NAD(P)-dependent oxidoreductase [Micromonosporaceae bacterium]